MADDREQLIGKWTVWVLSWVWEYEFRADGTMTWKDTRGPEKGVGKWAMSGSLVNLFWTDSTTKESWQRPLNSAVAVQDHKTFYSSPYFTGAYRIEKQRDAAHIDLPKTTQPDSEIEIDVIRGPQDHPNYIDNLCTYVAYGICQGGFWAYVPANKTQYPIEIPEKLVFFTPTGTAVSDRIYETQEAAIAAAGGVNSGRIAYYGNETHGIIFPTAFTMKTTPIFVNTASIVVDKLVAEVTEELKDIMIMLTVRIAISTIGAIISRTAEVRRLKTREGRAKAALENARQARQNSATTVTTVRPRATTAQLREMLKNPNDWYVWATEDAGIVENQDIVFKGKTNFAANQQVHLLKGNDGIRGTKYGGNKVAIRINSQYIRHFTGNEYLTDEIAASNGLHFFQSDINALK